MYNAAQAVKEWRKKNPEKHKAQKRRANLKKRFGLSVQDYNQRLEKQEGRCAICKRFPEKKNLCVDHNHSTGKVRGLLCSQCNHAIGLLKEDLLIMNSAYEYVSKDGVC